MWCKNKINALALSATPAMVSHFYIQINVLIINLGNYMYVKKKTML